MVRKLGSKLLITRQKCVKVRPYQTGPAEQGGAGGARVRAQRRGGYRAQLVHASRRGEARTADLGTQRHHPGQGWGLEGAARNFDWLTRYVTTS